MIPVLPIGQQALNAAINNAAMFFPFTVFSPKLYLPVICRSFAGYLPVICRLFAGYLPVICRSSTYCKALAPRLRV